jgi:RimJ/RimL family protein N-acetyltransferase
MHINKYTQAYKKAENLFTIDCGEIILREFRIEDAEDIYDISSEADVSKYLPDWKSTKEQRLEWVKNYEIPANRKFLEAVSRTPNIVDEHLKLGIILKESGKFIGWCCTGIKDELPAPNREIMYAISKDFGKRGYATLASKGLINYLFEKTNVEYLNALALIENAPSNRVIEKCGFDFFRCIKIDNELYNYYTLNKNQWEWPSFQ